MKRLILISVLLALSAILAPALFPNVGANVEIAAWEEIPEDSPEPRKNREPVSEVSPEPSGHAAHAAGNELDSNIKFTALIDGELVETTMAEYLPLAVAAEMPASFATEALKAQAVAARTYIIYCTKFENPNHPEADICSESGCCLAYSNEMELRASWGAAYEENMSLVRSAVESTDGQVLFCEQQPIMASFHSSSAGKTEDGSELWGNVPYLVSVLSPETEEDVPDFVTTVEVSVENFRETILLLKPEAELTGNGEGWIGKADRDESGRIRSVIIGNISLTGSEMRKLFCLKSTAFVLEFLEGRFLFTVTGYGHGLGMSQYGANVMAQNGFNYEEILLHYYSECQLKAYSQ